MKKIEIKTDTSKHYLIPRSKKSDGNCPIKTFPIICKVTATKDGLIICEALSAEDLYWPCNFDDNYFQYLLQIGYIKIYKEGNSNDYK